MESFDKLTSPAGTHRPVSMSIFSMTYPVISEPPLSSGWVHWTVMWLARTSIGSKGPTGLDGLSVKRYNTLRINCFVSHGSWLGHYYPGRLSTCSSLSIKDSHIYFFLSVFKTKSTLSKTGQGIWYMESIKNLRIKFSNIISFHGIL